MNKKGDVLSILIIIVMITILAIVIYFFSYFSNNITYAIGDSGLNFSAEANKTINDLKTTGFSTGDTMMAVIIFGWFIALIFAAVYTDFSPVVIGFFILILVLGVYLSAQLTVNFYDDVNDQLSPTIEGGKQMSLTNILLGEYFPWIVLFIGVIIAIVIYNKKGGGGF